MDLKQYPMLAARTGTAFYRDLTSEGPIYVNGSHMPRGLWNALISHRDLKLWYRAGLKPHRGWKVSDCKRYFGLKGSGATLLSEFEALKAEALDFTRSERHD